MPEWLIQVLVAATLAVIAWFLRGLREDVDGIKLDLAKNYVTHEQLRELRRDQRKMLAMLTRLQIQLAKVHNFKPISIEDVDDDDEDA